MKITRTTKETIIIVTLSIVAVLAIVAIMRNSGAVGAAAAPSGHSYKHAVYNPLPTVYASLTWEIARSSGGTVDTSDACHTYHLSDRFGGLDNPPATACAVGTVATVTETAPEAVTVANEPIVSETVETVKEPAKESKKHCNNGNGNGAEGCNASDAPHSNQDETPERQDNTAGETHGNNGGEHGNGNGGGNH